MTASLPPLRLLAVAFLAGALLAEGGVAGAQAGDPAAAMVAAARRSLEAGKPAEAVEHLLHAWTVRPGDDDLVALLLQACAADPDARALWTHEWTERHADASGKAAPKGDLKALWPKDDPAAADLAAARARATAALVKFAREREAAGRNSPGELVVAWWARRLAADLASVSPALAKSLPEGLARRLTVPPRFWLPVLEALEQAMDHALGKGNAADATRAARILRGLAVQAAFKDLQGEKPQGIEKFGAAAARGLARAQALRPPKTSEPWTVEALGALSEEECEAFTRAHSDFSNPGVALSPTGLYRIETDCGYETLLGVATTIEAHHRRLVGWFGKDPFAGRPGLVRIVPEAVGLESEGAPFWWVGGFQGGDVTTVRLSCGRIEDLGHTLTHELTHRFDGALHPGCPAWLAEGRAVWTGSAYGHSSEETFVEAHASFGTIEEAWRRGYGGKDALLRLLEGTIDDYRDNYVAGYALFVYLNTEEAGGKRLYGERLAAFLKGGARGGKEAVPAFEKHFADGREGRPRGIEAFAQAFGAFAGGFYWLDRKEWTKRYTEAVPAGPPDPWVYDEPTWVWSRNRAEPTFGEGQAVLAGALLEGLGKRDAAARAYVWALAEDGPNLETEARLAALFAEAGKADPAWVLRRHAALPHGPDGEPAPFKKALADVWAYSARLRAAAEAALTGGRALAAVVLAADQDRVAAWLGEPTMGPAFPAGAALLHPVHRPGRLIDPSSWTEDGLTDYERHRVKNLWYATADGDLHVGREKPRQASGTMDRAAHLRHAFARGSEWLLPGTWRVRMRLQLTTTYVDGAVILGYARRDRHVRFQFSAGDYMYSIGQKDEATKVESVGWHMTGLRVREGGLPGSAPGGTHAFGQPAAGFELELIVDGAVVHAAIDGTPVAEFHTVDGAPLEGYVGFASSFGAYQVMQPVIERLDRNRLAGRSVADRPGLDFARRGRGTLSHHLERLCRSLASAPTGSLLLWIGPEPASEAPEFDADRLFEEARSFVSEVGRRVVLEDLTQPFVLAVPEAAGRERIAAFLDDIEKELGRRPVVATHAWDGRRPVGDLEDPELGGSWCVFADHHGTVRMREPWVAGAGGFSDGMRHWLRVFRDHGRPQRRLPEVKRPDVPDGGAEEGK